MKKLRVLPANERDGTYVDEASAIQRIALCTRFLLAVWFVGATVGWLLLDVPPAPISTVPTLAASDRSTAESAAPSQIEEKAISTEARQIPPKSLTAFGTSPARQSAADPPIEQPLPTLPATSQPTTVAALPPIATTGLVPEGAFDELFDGPFQNGGRIFDLKEIRGEGAMTVAQGLVNLRGVVAVPPVITRYEVIHGTMLRVEPSVAAGTRTVLSARVVAQPSALSGVAPTHMRKLGGSRTAVTVAPRMVSVTPSPASLRATAPGAIAPADRLKAETLISERLPAPVTQHPGMPGGAVGASFNVLAKAGDLRADGAFRLNDAALPLARELVSPMARRAAEPVAFDVGAMLSTSKVTGDRSQPTQMRLARIPKPRPINVPIASSREAGTLGRVHRSKVEQREQPAASRRDNSPRIARKWPTTPSQPPQRAEVVVLPPALLPTRPPRSGTH